VHLHSTSNNRRGAQRRHIRILQDNKKDDEEKRETSYPTGSSDHQPALSPSSLGRVALPSDTRQHSNTKISIAKRSSRARTTASTMAARTLRIGTYYPNPLPIYSRPQSHVHDPN
jgi:hypothetical protein